MHTIYVAGEGVPIVLWISLTYFTGGIEVCDSCDGLVEAWIRVYYFCSESLSSLLPFGRIL